MNDQHAKPASPADCPICAELPPVAFAFQKYGWEEEDTHLPAAAGWLVVIRDFKPASSRKRQLWQCPTCATCYLYETDYEYLVNGTEDEETLTRLSAEDAARILGAPPSSF